VHNRGKLFIRLLLPVLGVLLTASPSLRSEKGEPVPERLLPSEYDVWSLDWSSDERIVFAGKQEGEEGTKMRIWLSRLRPDTSPVLWTGTGTLIDSAPKWAPDGSGVVMVRKTAPTSSQPEMKTAIWWKAFPSGEGLRLTSGREDRDPTWSPDGENILFVRGEGLYSSSLLTIKKNGAGLKTLLAKSQGFIATPNWGSNNQIYYTLLKPRKTLVKTESQSEECWGLDQGSVWVYDPSTGEHSSLLDDGNDNRHPVVSPTGRYLAYISTRGNDGAEVKVIRDRGSLFILDLKTGERLRITDGVSLNGGPPCWSPDGDRLVFFSFRDNRPAAWILEWRKYAIKD
jgi:Tol biopolymer transport system component